MAGRSVAVRGGNSPRPTGRPHGPRRCGGPGISMGYLRARATPPTHNPKLACRGPRPQLAATWQALKLPLTLRARWFLLFWPLFCVWQIVLLAAPDFLRLKSLPTRCSWLRASPCVLLLMRMIALPNGSTRSTSSAMRQIERPLLMRRQSRLPRRGLPESNQSRWGLGEVAERLKALGVLALGSEVAERSGEAVHGKIGAPHALEQPSIATFERPLRRGPR